LPKRARLPLWGDPLARRSRRGRLRRRNPRFQGTADSRNQARRYLEENVGAADVELTPEELDRIESAFPKGATAGDRYPDMSTVNR
jgi:hypothetical protein